LESSENTPLLAQARITSPELTNKIH
jgi:hypothetical protein